MGKEGQESRTPEINGWLAHKAKPSKAWQGTEQRATAGGVVRCSQPFLGATNSPRDLASHIILHAVWHDRVEKFDTTREIEKKGAFCFVDWARRYV